MSRAGRILLYVSNAALGQTPMTRLSSDACDIVWCNQESEGLALLRDKAVDAAVLCLSSGADDLEVLNRIADVAGDVPFLIATPAHETETRIRGLKRGAADYLVLPFGADELLDRVTTAMRRRDGFEERFLRHGKVVLDRETGRVGDGATWTVLSPSERKLFSMLFGSVDRPVSKQRLRTALADNGGLSDNAIEVGIHRLRVKARAFGMRIQTYRNTGYVLEEARI